jgi:hypothetical protein
VHAAVSASWVTAAPVLIQRIEQLPNTTRLLVLSLTMLTPTTIPLLQQLQEARDLQLVLLVPAAVEPDTWYQRSLQVRCVDVWYESALTVRPRWHQLERLAARPPLYDPCLQVLRAYAMQGPLQERHALVRLVDVAVLTDNVKDATRRFNDTPSALAHRFTAVGLATPKVLLHSVRTSLFLALLELGVQRHDAAALLATDVANLAATYKRTAEVPLATVCTLPSELTLRWTRAMLLGQQRYVSVAVAYKDLLQAHSAAARAQLAS